jgi:NAD(P)-dependent dehydrogenase (short-subunit alcohol dehydrogenase family)
MKPVFVVLCVALAATFGPAHAATVLITGADRGLGLEFTRQYAARGDTVIATCRHPEDAAELQALAAAKKTIVVEKLDLTDDAGVRSLATKYHGKPIDVLINNAGTLGDRDGQMLGTFSRKGSHDVMDVNAFGPLVVSEAFRDNVVAGKEKKIVAVTSGSMGSISRAADLPRRPYFYRMSKAALTMGLQALGADLKTQGVAVAVVSPGVADTAMHVKFRDDYGINNPAITPARSVTGMIAVIDKLDQTQAARGILSYDGTVIGW